MYCFLAVLQAQFIVWHCRFQSFLSPALLCCHKILKNDRRSGRAQWWLCFRRLPLWSSQPKTHRQTVGGFGHDLSPQLCSSGVSRGRVAISAEASTCIAEPIFKEMCMSPQGWEKELLRGEMNQPLSSATRPLTYWAHFNKTQRSTLTLSGISLSLLPLCDTSPTSFF